MRYSRMKISQTIKNVCNLILHTSFFIITLLLVGCSTHLPKTNYNPSTVDMSEPQLNRLTQRSVGERMTTQRKLELVDLLRVTNTIKPAFAITITPGTYRKIGKNGDIQYYKAYGEGDDGGAVQELIGGPYPFKAVMLKTNENQICAIAHTNEFSCTSDIDGRYQLEKKLKLSNDSIQQTLIYSGRLNNKIKFTYREFTNNLARPAFSNDVEYDLLGSNTISYKGALIEVFEANNQYIKYIVRKNFKRYEEPTFPDSPVDLNIKPQEKKEII